MSYRDEVIEQYKILLAIGWLKADDEGNVSLVIGDDVVPATIDGKRVVLPTREQMKNRNWEHRIGFHPLRERYNLGISDVLANLRDQYVQRLNASIAYLMKELIEIGRNVEGQKELSTEQLQVMNALQHCNDNTKKTFEMLNKKTRAQNNADQFVNIFIKRGGEVRGQSYGRAAIVSFPIYQQLLDGADKINGVKITGKEREMFIKLFKFIFPTIDDKDAFNVGINTKTAPFLESLVRAVFGVVDDLVTAAKPYMNLVDLPTLLEFPENMGRWVEIFDSKDLVEKLAASIPDLTRGDEGVEEEKKPEPARTESRQETHKEQDRNVEIKANVQADKSSPRGRMILGAPSGATGESLGKSQSDQGRSAPSVERAVTTGRSVSRDSDLDREESRKRREEEDRIRRQRDREDEEERIRRRRERDEEDDRRRSRDRDSRDSRDDRDDRDRDDRRGRDRDDDRDRDRRTGDIFEDNPVLRGALRDEEEYSRRGRSRDRYDRDDRDDRGRNRVRDIRDRGSRDRYDRDYDDRYDRDYDRYDRDRSRYRR